MPADAPVLESPGRLEDLLRSNATPSDGITHVIIQPNDNPRHAAIELQSTNKTYPGLFSSNSRLTNLHARISEQTTYGMPRGLGTDEHTWRFASPAHAELAFGPYYLNIDSRWRDARPPEETRARLFVEYEPSSTQQDILRRLSEVFELRGVDEHMYRSQGDYDIGPQMTYLNDKKQASAITDLYTSNQPFRYRSAKHDKHLFIEHQKQDDRWEFSIEVNLHPSGLFRPKITRNHFKRIYRFITRSHEDINTKDHSAYVVRVPNQEHA